MFRNAVIARMWSLFLVAAIPAAAFGQARVAPPRAGAVPTLPPRVNAVPVKAKPIAVAQATEASGTGGRKKNRAIRLRLRLPRNRRS